MEARKQPAPGGLAIATFGFNCHLNVGDGLAAREQIAHPAERFEHFVLGGMLFDEYRRGSSLDEIVLGQMWCAGLFPVAQKTSSVTITRTNRAGVA